VSVNASFPWKLLHGDALILLPGIERASVDIMIADPPYSSGGMVRGDRMASTSTKYVSSDTSDKGVDFSGDNRDQRAYLAWTSLWVAHARAALKVGAWSFVFADWRQLATTIDAVQAGGLVFRSIFTWHKPAHRRVMGGVSPACEYAVVCSNGPVDTTGPQIEGFYSESAPSARVHQTQKPAGLIAHLLKMARPGSLVLDPFAGSGTTGAAAVGLGHRFVGMELNDHYFQVATDRLSGVVRSADAEQISLV
jgi:site-specific DNA-methyltransferase (adenine-specific)